MASTARTAFALLLVSALAGVSFAARGKIVDLGFPEQDFDGSKAFCSMYDFGWNTGDGPCIYTGHSSGGNHTYQQAADNAANTVCATPHGWKHDAPRMELKEVPVYTQTGSGDFGNYDVEMAQKANSMGLRESVGWGRGLEHSWSNPGLMYLFWAECIRLRYPPGSSLRNTPRDEGWLGDMSPRSWESDCPYIAPYDDYKRDKSTAAWLPTRYFAFCWRAFVLGRGTYSVSPIVITMPKAGGKWTGWPMCGQGENVDIQALYTSKGVARVDICYGDNVIKSFPAKAYGVYTVQWKAVAGIHGIVAVAYNDRNQPMATSRLITIIVTGKVEYAPVDNSARENAEPFDATAAQGQPAPRVLRVVHHPAADAMPRLLLLNGRRLSPVGDPFGGARGHAAVAVGEGRGWCATRISR